MTFPRMPCSWLSVDAMDISGEVQLEVDHDVYKRRLSADGRALDSGEGGGDALRLWRCAAARTRRAAAERRGNPVEHIDAMQMSECSQFGQLAAEQGGHSAC